MRIKHVLMAMVLGVLGILGAADRAEAQCVGCGSWDIRREVGREIAYQRCESGYGQATACRAIRENRRSHAIEWCYEVGTCRRRPRGDDDAYLVINPAASRWAWADTSPVKAPSCGTTPNHSPSEARPGAPTRETLVTLADLERE